MTLVCKYYTADLLEITVKEIKKPKYQASSSNITPSKEICISNCDEDEKVRMKKLLEMDDAYYDSLMDQEEYRVDMQNAQLGFYMESIISMQLPCPVCGEKKLRKFKNQNIHMIDMVCLNDHPTNLFQLKISQNGGYFNKKHRYITAKPDLVFINSIDCPGYICIQLKKDIYSDHESYSIVHANSFILLPDLLKPFDYYFNSDRKNTYGQNTISWTDNVVILPVPDIGKIRAINLDVYVIDNPHKNKCQN